MFHKMKLKPYLLSAFGVMILLAGIITALGIIGLVSISKNTDALVNQVLNPINGQPANTIWIFFMQCQNSSIYL